MSEKKGLFGRLKEGLKKTRSAFSESVNSVLGAFTKIDEELFEELFEVMVSADIGAGTAMDIVDELRDRAKSERVSEPAALYGLLKDIIAEKLSFGEAGLPEGSPLVIFVTGVNGVGKTTTIGKLAERLRGDKKKVLLAAGDTFRAAAINQLEVWAERSGADIIRGNEGADPASVIFDAVNAAKKRGTDVLICDTAGRMHNKKNLMDELEKMYRIIERELPAATRENLLVLDASTGQNAVNQARMFKDVSNVTGIVLTKLDGTAKGGIVISICAELGIPIKYIGVGEKIDDLQPFDAAEFAAALFDGS